MCIYAPVTDTAFRQFRVVSEATNLLLKMEKTMVKLFLQKATKASQIHLNFRENDRDGKFQAQRADLTAHIASFHRTRITSRFKQTFGVGIFVGEALCGYNLSQIAISENYTICCTGRAFAVHVLASGWG